MDVDQQAAARYPDTEKGRCISCGYLAMGHMYPVGKQEPPIGEIGPWSRQSGNVGDGSRWSYAFCFRGAADVFGEIKDAHERISPDGGPPFIQPSAETVLTVLRKERHCPDWYPYQAGLSPKDHLGQMVMVQMEQARRDHEREMQRLEGLIQVQAVKAAETTNRLTRWGVVLAIILVVLAVATVVFAALGWLAPKQAPVNIQLTLPTPTP